jgi:site-specific recombinase
VTALLNVGVAFGCALMLALRARDIPRRLRRVVFKTVAKRVAISPTQFLLPGRGNTLARPLVAANDNPDGDEEQRTGSDR